MFKLFRQGVPKDLYEPPEISVELPIEYIFQTYALAAYKRRPLRVSRVDIATVLAVANAVDQFLQVRNPGRLVVYRYHSLRGA